MFDDQIPELAPPDLPGLFPMQPPTPATPMGAAPQQPAQQGGDLSELMPLLPLIAAAGKAGGRTGIAAFLQGIQQARQRKQQEGRLAAQDQRLAAQDQRLQGQADWQQQYQQQQLEAQRQQRMQQVRSQFATALQNIDDPAAIPELARFFAADGLVPQPELERFAMTTQPPTRIQKRAAEARVSRLRTEFGTKWMEEGAKFTHELPGGERVDFPELLRRAGMEADPNAPKQQAQSAILPDVPLDRQHAMAIASGNTQLAGQIEEAMRRQDATRRDPPQAGSDATRTNARIDRIVTSFNSHPIVKEYNETQAQLGIIQNVVAGQWSGPGDMAAVFAFMKALDPNSVVRETEYANAARSGNIFMGWAARFNGAISPNGGFLSEQVRRDFLATINARMKVKTQQYQNLRKQLVGRIDRIKAGAPETGDEALVEYETGAQPQPEQPAATPRQKTPNPFRR